MGQKTTIILIPNYSGIFAITSSEEQQQQQIKEFELINAEINTILLDPTNPNVMTAEQMAGMRKSMQQYGYLAPVILDQNNKICDGEHRVLIYKELGLTHIPAYKINLDSDADRRQLRQVMNKLHGQHDHSKDADELLAIMQASQDKTLKELSQLIAQPEEELMRTVLRYHPAIDYLMPENQDQVDRLIDEEMQRISPDAKLSEIYQLGNHRIICADCTDVRSVKRLLGEETIDCIITDPPYSSGGWQEAGRVGSSSKGTSTDEGRHVSIVGDGLSTRGYISLMKEALSNIHADVLYLFCDWRMWSWSYDVAEACNYPVKNMIVWDKMYQGMGFPWRAQHELILYGKKTAGKMTPELNRGNVIQCERTGNIHHATEKPTKLLNMVISNTEGCNTFYDPFLGSGSTLIACEQLGRKCYGVEIDPRYIDITIKRWETYTGQKAEKVSS